MIGVRISWLMVARKPLFAALAASAAARASSAAAAAANRSASAARRAVRSCDSFAKPSSAPASSRSAVIVTAAQKLAPSRRTRWPYPVYSPCAAAHPRCASAVPSSDPPAG